MQDMPKLVGEDVMLFLGIMSDLFPGSELPEPAYGTLQIAIEVPSLISESEEEDRYQE